MSHLVSVVKQSDYDPSSLDVSLRRAIDLCGFDLASVGGRRLLLKPNMLGAYPPSMGVTTRPEFVAAAGRIFKSAGATVLVGDSPNGVHMPKRTWEVTGIGDVCKREGFEVVSFESSGSVSVDGRMISQAVLSADIVVNLPKFKTHGLTVMTLAVKNLFGCISGLQKSGVHRAFPNVRDFAGEIVRIAEAVRPALNIVDGVIAMEGDGPSAGDLLNMGIVIAGTEMHRVDEACCRLIGLDPDDLDTLSAAKSMGFWNDDGGTELTGDGPGRIDFRLPSTFTKGSRDWWISKLATRLIFGSLHARLSVDPGLCKRCGLCIDACPVEAMKRTGSEVPPGIDQDLCIQCFCCHEVCPHKAISVKQSAMLRLWRGFLERRLRKAGTRNSGL